MNPSRDRVPTSDEGLRVLSVRGRNPWRSPPAGQVWRRHPQVQVRPAGTGADARRGVGEAAFVGLLGEPVADLPGRRR